MSAFYVRVVPGAGIFMHFATCEHGSVSGMYCGLCFGGFAAWRGTLVLSPKV